MRARKYAIVMTTALTPIDGGLDLSAGHSLTLRIIRIADVEANLSIMDEGWSRGTAAYTSHTQICELLNWLEIFQSVLREIIFGLDKSPFFSLGKLRKVHLRSSGESLRWRSPHLLNSTRSRRAVVFSSTNHSIINCLIIAEYPRGAQSAKPDLQSLVFFDVTK